MTREIAPLALATSLLVGIVVTSIALVTTTHESRRLFQQLQSLQDEEDRLQGIWSALELEVSTLAEQSSIARFARDELGMVEPRDEIEYVVLPR